MVLALLCVGVPLALVVANDGGGGGDRRAPGATKEAPAPDEGEAPPHVDPRPPTEEARAYIGTWIIDRAMLERRLRELGGPGKRSPRLLPGAQEIERMLKSELTLQLGGDGRFSLRVRGLRRGGPEQVEGTWRRADEVLLFHPSPPPRNEARKEAATTFLGRPAKGGLMLEALGMRVLLRKQ
jgi:hypothetical protein